MTHWGAIAAIAAALLGAAICGANDARADAASVRASLEGRILASSTGVASYYGPGFHGRPTASGEIFDRNGLSAASRTLPIPCYARVTNLANGRSLIVRVNDRGPFVAGRMLDLSERAARLLAFHGGMSRVRLDYLGKAGPAGPDDSRALLASLNGGHEPVAAAAARPAFQEARIGRTSALGYAEPARTAPAAAALDAALRTPAPPQPIGLAAGLDAAARRLKAALEAVDKVASGAGKALTPYGGLVVAPFRPLAQTDP